MNLFRLCSKKFSDPHNGVGYRWEHGAFQATLVRLAPGSQWRFWWHAGVATGSGGSEDKREAFEKLRESLLRAKARYVKALSALYQVTIP